PPVAGAGDSAVLATAGGDDVMISGVTMQLAFALVDQVERQQRRRRRSWAKLREIFPHRRDQPELGLGAGAVGSGQLLPAGPVSAPVPELAAFGVADRPAVMVVGEAVFASIARIFHVTSASGSARCLRSWRTLR